MAFKFNKENQLFINTAQNTNKHIFLTWDAWTWKTTTLQYFINNSNWKKLLLLWSTWSAAINIWWMTIHKFFWLNHEFSISRIKQLDQDKIEILKHIDTIIIDEASMVRVDLIDLMDQILKRSLMTNNPFWWKQLILIWDLFQLPPVVTDHDKVFLKDLYKWYYFFNSNVWNEIEKDLIYTNLTTIYRQSDLEFSWILNRIREWQHTSRDLNKINKNIVSDISSIEWNPLYITTTNKTVQNMNEESLMNIKKQNHTFRAIVEWNFTPNLYPNLEILNFREWASIMFIKNDNELRRSNWTLWKITRILPNNSILVKIDWQKKDVIVNQESWVISEPYFDVKSNEIKYTKKWVFKQLPITLSYAVTIHKSQWKTFESGYIDLWSGTFAFWQAYVALSRIKSLDKLYLKKAITNTDIKTDKKVVDFMKKLLTNNTK